MKAHELRTLTDTQLVLTYKDVTRALVNLLFRGHAGREGSANEVRKIKRDIARIITVQHERRLARTPAGGPPQTGGRLSRPQRRGGHQGGAASTSTAPNQRPRDMSTILDQARATLLGKIDPHGNHFERVRGWVQRRPPGSTFSLREAVQSLGKDVPAGGISLVLSELVSRKEIEESFRMEVNGEPTGKTYPSLSDVPIAELTAEPVPGREQLLVPCYRRP